MKRLSASFFASCLFLAALFGGAACGGKNETVDNGHKLSAHSEDNVCEHCGEKLYGGEVKYELSENEKYYIATIGDEAEGDVVLPAYYKDMAGEYLPVLELKEVSSQNVGKIKLSAVLEKASVYSRPDGNSVSYFEAASENAYLKTEDGVLFNKAGTKLIAYPCNKDAQNYTIPEEVEEICDGAFYYCCKLEEIEIPAASRLKKIGRYAFYHCYKAKSIVIPESVESVGTTAFKLWGKAYYREEGETNPENISAIFVEYEKSGLPAGWVPDWDVNVEPYSRIVYGYKR